MVFILFFLLASIAAVLYSEIRDQSQSQSVTIPDGSYTRFFQYTHPISINWTQNTSKYLETGVPEDA
jgi:hypothetical membrane protein